MRCKQAWFVDRACIFVAVPLVPCFFRTATNKFCLGNGRQDSPGATLVVFTDAAWALVAALLIAELHLLACDSFREFSHEYRQRRLQAENEGRPLTRQQLLKFDAKMQETEVLRHLICFLTSSAQRKINDRMSSSSSVLFMFCLAAGATQRICFRLLVAMRSDLECLQHSAYRASDVKPQSWLSDNRSEGINPSRVIYKAISWLQAS